MLLTLLTSVTFFVEGYTLVNARTTKDEIILTFNEKLLEQHQGVGIAMNVFERTDEFVCELRPVYYEKPINSESMMKITEVPSGWQYVLDRRGYGEICYIDVWTKQGKSTFWINGRDNYCTKQDVFDIDATDCENISSPINLTKIWWSTEIGGFILFFEGSYNSNASLYLTFENQGNTGTLSGLYVLDEGFKEIILSRGDYHCNEKVFAMIVENNTKVVSASRLDVECTNYTTPVCGDFVCEKLEKELCEEDCANPFNEKFDISISYGEIYVKTTATLPEPNCDIVLSGPGFIKAHRFEQLPLTRFNESGVFMLENATSGTYSVFIKCESLTSPVSTTKYCNGCKVEENCLNEYDSFEDNYCSKGEFKKKESNDVACQSNSMCVSDYCSSKGVCAPSFILKRWIWSLKKR
jgi:hypothetical protein